LFRVPVLALVGCRLEELALYELLLFAVVQFHHANIALPAWLDQALRTVIVTPHLHKVHHSVVVAEQHANFSSLFSWWDRAARTFRLAPELSRIKFGVDEDTSA
jgi:sterol desaturase/sphingolipid hydroxylase (fatty acid hydroxylase superfamily)